MTHNQVQLNRERLQEDAGRRQIVYEVYPDGTGLAPAIPFDWFEIALYAEVNEYLPPEHPRSREALSALMDVADLLIQRLPTHALCVIDLSPSYYTLHPPACGNSTRARLSRSLSLAFSNVEPYKHLDELPFFPALKTQLELLHISRLESHREDQKETTQGRH